ncbi:MULTISPECIES: response regulator transcription factor [unclassified Duganella]|uniref:LuxR C-terminal-related transcriptional regulator n=1 Tax=unclassified Duganella TaxID=2636909 RepID=UPI001E4D55D2|nr:MULTISPECIES: response regulator transcription factor [unclassified Duganella]
MSQQKTHINVLIAHADAIVSAGLAALLAAQADLRISIATGDNAAIHADTDIILLDHGSAMQHTRRNWPRRLIVTHLDREWDVYTAMTAGVHGYLLQNADARELLTAVRTLGRGMHYLSAELHDRVVDSATRIDLTSRETDVLQLLAQGLCNKLIARELGIGVGTVKTHVRGLFDKLGATARTHAVVLAMRRGLLARA